MSEVTLKELIDSTVIIESIGNHRHSILWFHGFGDSSDGYKDLFRRFQPANTKILLPNAPKRWVTIEGRRYHTRSWYDHDEKTIEKGVQFNELIKALIDEELKLVENSSHIIIGGFSQGACLSLLVGLTYSKGPLGGIISCSGQWMRKDSLSSFAKEIPIFVLHGKDDNRIKWDEAKTTYEYLKTLGLKDNMYVIVEDGVGHTISQQGLFAMMMFIHQKLKI